MLALSFLTLLALPAQAESPPCDCLDGPLLTGAPPCVEVGFAGCYLGAADASLINQWIEIVLVDFPVDDGLGASATRRLAWWRPARRPIINSVGSYTLKDESLRRGHEPGARSAAGRHATPQTETAAARPSAPGPRPAPSSPSLGWPAGARRRDARGLG